MTHSGRISSHRGNVTECRPVCAFAR
jgi:hypothetical protein